MDISSRATLNPMVDFLAPEFPKTTNLVRWHLPANNPLVYRVALDAKVRR